MYCICLAALQKYMEVDCFVVYILLLSARARYPGLDVLSWNSTGKIGRIGRHRAETHRHFNISFFGQMPPDASDFLGGIPALDIDVCMLVCELNGGWGWEGEAKAP